MLEELRQAAELLRGLLAAERQAIVALDRTRLAALAVDKERTAARFTALQAAAPTALPPDLANLLTVLRLEARVTATMSTLAADAVRGSIE
jgi:hypothetical protein